MQVDPPATVIEIAGQVDQWLRSGYGTLLIPVPTGFREMDRLLGGGFYPEDLVIVGGMQGIGKTALCMQIAANIAARGNPVCYVCYEHSSLTLFLRMLCMAGGVPWQEVAQNLVRAASIDDALQDERLRQAWMRFGIVWERLSFMEGRPTLSVDVLEMVMRDICRTGIGTPILIVDYIQIVPVRPDMYGRVPQNVAEQVHVVMQYLKSIATRFHGVVIGVSAARKTALQEGYVRIGDLLGSELVQYHPDTVILINPVRNGDDGKGMLVDLTVAKNRHGPLGSIRMRMSPHFSMQEVGTAQEGIF